LAHVRGPQSGSRTDAETTTALAQLGYLDGLAPVAGDVPFSALPDPKSAPDLEERFDALVIAARTRPPTEAVPLLEAFIAENPGVFGARQLLSVARELAGDRAGAREALEPLLAIHTDDPMLRARRAELWMLDGEWTQAQEDLERVLARQPDHTTALAIRAELARQQGHCDAALRDVERGLAGSPESARLRLIRGACRLSLGDASGARADLEAVLTASPADVDADFLLGVALLREGRVEDALPRLEAQVARTPTAPLARSALAAGLYGAGRYDDARPHLEAVASAPLVGEEPAWMLADVILRAGGPYAEVERWLQVAESRRPNHAPVHRVRSALLMAHGQVDAALAEMRAATAGEQR
jgi:predicted Zn-dependent protease